MTIVCKNWRVNYKPEAATKVSDILPSSPQNLRKSIVKNAALMSQADDRWGVGQTGRASSSSPHLEQGAQMLAREAQCLSPQLFESDVGELTGTQFWAIY